MTIEQFKKATKEKQNEFLAPFKNLKENISDYIVVDAMTIAPIRKFIE